MIGQTLGHYRVLEQIGAGGMGLVFRAHDERLERDVALKVLPPGTLGDESARGRFRKEALTLSKLNHPNIETVFDFDTQDGVDFLVMELVPGATLDQKLGAGGLPEKEVLRLGQQLAEALAAAHEQGIVHRDLKPGNLSLTPDGRLKILDFGLAKLLHPVSDLALTDSLSATHGPVGTLPYMAPEQLRGEKADARSDLWSAGTVLYEMATGRRPFDSRVSTALAGDIQHTPPPFPRQLRPELSPRLEELILKCLEKDAEDRYQSARELGIDLRRLSAGASTASSAAALPAKRSRKAVVAAGSLALVMALLAAFVWSRWVRPEASLPPLTIRPLTSFVGMEWGPSWSPDGSFVAYSHNRYGHMDIFVIPTGGGDPVRLTDNPADDLTPRWSPDGRYIAFLSDRGTGTNVYLIPPLGGAERKLAETNIPWLEKGMDALAALGSAPWSPDSSQLLFSCQLPSGGVAVCSINPSSGTRTQLTQPPPGAADTYASWSLDGKRIAFGRNQGGKFSLWVMDAQGGEPELLLADQYVSMTPAWAADDQRLLFISNRSGPATLWEIEVASRRTRQITSGSGAVFMPTVSKTGRVLYTQYSHQVDLYWGAVDQPQEKHQRLTSHTQNNFGGRVSPDGQQVVYLSDHTGNYELWLLDRRTGAERKLTDDPAYDVMADWSPDGKEMVFLSGRGGSLQPWVLEVESGRVRRVSERSRPIPFEPHFSGPRWSPDGKAIGFVAAGEKEEALWVVDPQGKNEHEALAGVIGFDWYRDSRHVVYTRRAADGSGVVEMRAADLESGQEALLLRGPTAELVVSRDGRGVAFLHAASHFNMQLQVLRLSPPASPGKLPRAVGKPRQITHGEETFHVHNGGWSPDGKAVVYTRDNDSGDVYVIENYR